MMPVSEIIILMVLHLIISPFHNFIHRPYVIPSLQFEILGFNLPGVSCEDSLSLFPCHVFGPEVF